MIKSLVIALIILGMGFGASFFYLGYPRAGKSYIAKHREQRKSLRHGSGFYYMGGRGFRGGK